MARNWQQQFCYLLLQFTQLADIDSTIEQDMQAPCDHGCFNLRDTTADLVAAIVDRNGAILARSRHFDDAISVRSFDLARQSSTRRLGSVQYYISINNLGLDSYSSLIAHAPLELARNWELPSELNIAKFSEGQTVLLGLVRPAQRHTLRDACQAYGLSEAQARIAIALIETSNLRRAALAKGLSYSQARECHRGVLRKLGTDSTPAMVTQLLAPSFGRLPKADHAGQFLASAFGLTKRQASMAISIADGFSRAESAQSHGISQAVAKKELDLVFVTLGVSSATELARIVSDSRAIALITSPDSAAESETSSPKEPLEFLAHPSGRKIAYSDYGPHTAKPVLVLHSSMTNRPIFSAIVEALQAAGLRPISLDRPGFGLTDPVAGAKAGQHNPFDTAAEDAIWFCQAMGLGRINLLARGAAQVAYAIETRQPGLLDRVILVNPDPDARHNGKVNGPFGRMKQLFLRNPDFIGLYAHVYARLITPARGRFVMKRSIKGCAPDEAVMAREQNLADYVQAEQMFVAGRLEGFVNEQTAMASGKPPRPLPGTTRWTILVGEQDFIHDPLCALEYWKLALPDAEAQLVPNAGRFLAISHAEEIGRMLST